MEKGLYIYVSATGQCYDRTNGRNDKLEFNTDYAIVGGSVVLTKGKTDRQIYVSRRMENGDFAYTTDITVTGLYYVWALCVTPFPKTTRVVRTLYNQLKELSTKPKFIIQENSEYPWSSKVQLTFKRLMNGRTEIGFTVKLNPTMFDGFDIATVVDLVYRASKLHLGMIQRNNFPMVAVGQDYSITVDEEFVRDCKMKEEQMMTQVI